MRRGIIICIFLFIAGCKSKERIPDNILPQEKMQAILWDMMRADQFLADYVLNKDTTLEKKTESIRFYQQIFDINKVSKAKFQQSFAFYQSHPALLKIIMDSIATIVTPSPYEIKKTQTVTDSLNKKRNLLMPQDSTPVLKRINKMRKLKTI